MNTKSKTNPEQQVAINDLFDLVSLFDDLNRRYKVVTTPKKSDKQQKKGEDETG